MFTRPFGENRRAGVFLSRVLLWVSCRHPSIPDGVPVHDFLPLSGVLRDADSRRQRVEPGRDRIERK